NTPTPPTSTLVAYTTLFRSPNYRCRQIPHRNTVAIRFRWLSTHSTVYVSIDINVIRVIQISSPYIASCSPDNRLPDFPDSDLTRSEEHTSELQSRFELVCRL